VRAARTGWLPVAAALAASVGVLATPAVASAAKPCWQTVVDDWRDGRIDNRYSIACYRAALANAPEDLKMYSSFPEDVNRALQSSVRSMSSFERRGRANGPIGHALDRLSAKRADSVPIPLFVLAGLALLLVAAGVASVATRRLQTRRNRSNRDA
jgi:hypothetical protein